MHNFDLEKVLWNYKVYQRNSCSTTVKFGMNHPPVDFMIRVFDSEGIWFAFMNLTEDRIYYWVKRSPLGGDWVPYERISDYDH